MTPFPDLSDAEKIAAMRARAKTEAEQYGQTTVPAMLLQGAAWGEEVVRLRANVRALVSVAVGYQNMPGFTLHPMLEAQCHVAIAALEGPK